MIYGNFSLSLHKISDIKLNNMEIGKKYASILTVEDRHLACNVGSGDLPVLATPVMLSLMENAAMLCVADEVGEGSTTVGGHISSSHLRPTPLGREIKALAELVKVEGRKLSFRVQAFDENGLIGEGEHLRFIVDRSIFMSKVQ